MRPHVPDVIFRRVRAGRPCGRCVEAREARNGGPAHERGLVARERLQVVLDERHVRVTAKKGHRPVADGGIGMLQQGPEQVRAPAAGSDRGRSRCGTARSGRSSARPRRISAAFMSGTRLSSVMAAPTISVSASSMARPSSGTSPEYPWCASSRRAAIRRQLALGHLRGRRLLGVPIEPVVGGGGAGEDLDRLRPFVQRRPRPAAPSCDRWRPRGGPAPAPSVRA
jgi:hypothetical protein